MSETRWDRRYFESTRGQIVQYLRRSERTVSELAELLGLTDNAVRGHLAALERDGIVEQNGVRRGMGKPAHVYRTTVDAERMFGKAATPILGTLLSVLSDRLSSAELESLLRETGSRLAGAGEIEGRGIRARLEGVASFLAALGGMADVEVDGGTARIRGHGCPLAAVVHDQPEACRIAEALVEELVGAPVTERCERGERPCCVFEVDVAAAATAGHG